MDINVKTLLTISFATLFVAGCSNTNTDGSYAVGQQVQVDSNETGKAGVKHTHNGVAHTHLLPEGGLSHSHNYNSSTATNTKTCTPCNTGTRNTIIRRPAPVVNIPVRTTTTHRTGNSGNSHSHNGRRHTHPLPASGTNHVHQQHQRTPAVQPRPQQAVVHKPVVKPQQPASTTYYDYSGGSAPAKSNNTSYYNYGGSKGNGAKNQVTHAHNGVSHAHALPAAGVNHQHNQGSTSIGSTYGSSGKTSATSSASANSDYYIVKPKDTVFQVMRNTGIYWKTIIKLNNLQAPGYTINPGQKLRLK